MKVLMLPTLASFKADESGIKRVIEAYHKYAPEYGIEFVTDGDADVRVIHAGSSPGECDVAMLHGLYWTADYDASEAEYRTNARIVASLHYAREITVPSGWVAESIRRDLRVNPSIIPHGIEWDEWQHNEPNEGYVLWNKNRARVDVCNPEPVGELARRFSEHQFLTTFAPDNPTGNVNVIGRIPHDEMRRTVQRAGVYLSTTKETFGIGTLEAMAAGVPVLGFAEGGNLDLVQHGETGYLARPGNYDDLANGLDYCIRYRAALGANGREAVRAWTWQATMAKLVKIFERAMSDEPPTVGVVIPVYNKPEGELRRAVESAINQTYHQLTQVVVVDDGSADPQLYQHCIEDIQRKDERVRLIQQSNSGVANARNRGIGSTDTKYICCLDADDWIEPDFLRVCVNALQRDRSLGIAYTGMRVYRPDGNTSHGRWPGQADADKQAQGHNQVPTCCVFRRKVWQRLGGYRQRYAPTGAGAEDAELWLRMMAYGWRAEEVTEAPLFNYSWGTGFVSGDRNYYEVDWTRWHPWTKDGKYPLAAVMKPQRISHPVRQYDQPVISVVIPVGPGHEKLVIDALDSLEAQTFRKWEVIVVFDIPRTQTAHYEFIEQFKVAYPYIKTVWSAGYGKAEGAGHARNLGVNYSRAPFLLFLDADDWLEPKALELMLRAWNETESVVYSDYMRIVQGVSKDQADGAQRDRRLAYYDAGKQTAIVKFKAYEFDCERAIKQPEMPVPYYWCLTTCLVPKAWHDEIGGFDETMESWEDADYAFRMVRAGHCYTHVKEPLVIVRTYTGERLNRGLQIGDSLVKYMQAKYEGSDPVGCGSCGGSRRTASHSVVAKPTNNQRIEALDDESFIWCEYVSGNRGKHIVPANVTYQLTGKRYYEAGGARVLVHQDDVYVTDRHGRKTLNGKFIPIEEKHEVVVPESEPVQVTAPPEPVEPEPRPFNFQTLPGVTPSIAREFVRLDFNGPEDVLEAGVDGLQEIKGIGEAKATKIIGYLSLQ